MWAITIYVLLGTSNMYGSGRFMNGFLFLRINTKGKIVESLPIHFHLLDFIEL